MVCLGRYASLQTEFSAAVKISSDQKDLIVKLEQDLSTIQSIQSRPDAEVPSLFFFMKQVFKSR